MSTAPIAATKRSRPAAGASWKALSMPSLETNPSRGGTAAIDAAPMTTEPKVHGIRFHSGPRRRMSREPA